MSSPIKLIPSLLTLFLIPYLTLATYSALYYEGSGCSITKYAVIPMNFATCIWFPQSIASIYTFDGINSPPEYYAVGSASGPRANYIYSQSSTRQCGNLGSATFTNEQDQSNDVCQQPAKIAGVTFSGCIDYVTWTGECAGWHMAINCDKNSFAPQPCDQADANKDTFGSGNGSVGDYMRDELRKRNLTSTPPAAPRRKVANFVGDMVDEARANGACDSAYSDILLVKNHPRAVRQYCNGKDHISHFDQGTVLTRFDDEECA